MIIDGGDIEIGLESTIVDLTGEVPVILRPGYVTGEMLSETVGEVRLDPALMRQWTGPQGTWDEIQTLCPTRRDDSNRRQP